MGLISLRPRRAWLGLVFSVSILFACPIAYAAETGLVQFLAPFGDFSIRVPFSRPPPAKPEFYSDTGPQAGWQIDQWDIPGGRLSDFSKHREHDREIFKAVSAEALVKIVRARREESIELRQDGAVLPCTNPKGSPRESDLLFAPKDRLAGEPTALRTPPVPLDQLRFLWIDTVVAITTGMTDHPRGCFVNQGNAVVALILNDKMVSPPQTLFYQVGLNQPCAPIPARRFRECVHGLGRVGFFYKANPFGVDDRLPLLGQPFVRNRERRRIRLEVSQRIREIIAHSPPGMDHDPSHWVLGTTYAGQGIWGDFQMETKWERMRIEFLPNK